MAKKTKKLNANNNEEYVYKGDKSIKSIIIIIPNGVTSIGINAFCE